MEGAQGARLEGKGLFLALLKPWPARTRERRSALLRPTTLVAGCCASSCTVAEAICVMHTDAGAAGMRTGHAGCAFHEKTAGDGTRASRGRGRWKERLRMVPHTEADDFTIAHCTELSESVDSQGSHACGGRRPPACACARQPRGCARVLGKRNLFSPRR